MKKFKVTQIKSGIDRPERQKLTLKALGLTKMNASREVEATPQILGMIRAVNHLVKVEDISTAQDIEGSVGPVEEVASVNNTVDAGAPETTFGQLEESNQVAEEAAPAEEAAGVEEAPEAVETTQAEEEGPAQEESAADAGSEEEKAAGKENV